MICEVCRQRDADIVFKTVTGGQTATKAMCLSCANNLQQDMIKMFTALGFRPEGKVQEKQQAELPKLSMPRFVCTACGRPFSKLDNQTMAGCAQCYAAMEEELASHFLLPHEYIELDFKDEDLQEDHQVVDMQELKFRLLEAINQEDYETAANLRDQIKKQTNLQEDRT